MSERERVIFREEYYRDERIEQTVERWALRMKTVTGRRPGDMAMIHYRQSLYRAAERRRQIHWEGNDD